MSNRSAVFGGAGFIGTNLVYQLIEDGQQVFNFDNLSGLGNLLNIAELMQQSRHSFARCDITNPEEIDRYSLRQEANNDILKIYFQKDKGEFFAKSVKFKYPRQRKTVVADGVGQGYKEVQEISPNLRYIIDELDQICQRDRSEVDLKRKILDDLRHLESVVTNKISEIEADLEKLTRK